MESFVGSFPRIRRVSEVAAFAVCLGFAVHSAGSSGAASGSIGPLELDVVVTERPGVVSLHILLPAGVPAGSIEVQIAERDAVVLARDVDGVQRRSRTLRLSQSVVGGGAQAEFEPDGSLTIVLRAGPARGPTAKDREPRQERHP